MRVTVCAEWSACGLLADLEWAVVVQNARKYKV